MLDAGFDAGRGRSRGHVLVDSHHLGLGGDRPRAVEFDRPRYEGGAGYRHAFGDCGGRDAQALHRERLRILPLRWACAATSRSEKNAVLAVNLGRTFDCISNGVIYSTSSQSSFAPCSGAPSSWLSCKAC